MAMPALVLEMETPVEERVARLEANVDHMRSDVADIKIDLRRLNDKVEALDHSVASLALTTEKGFAELRTARALDRVWWLLMSAALLGVIARAVKWI